jgi:hypothetical protein
MYMYNVSLPYMYVMARDKWYMYQAFPLHGYEIEAGGGRTRQEAK